MSTKDIDSFLDSEIFENGQIVSYRSLSRQKLLHVNDAKNKLHAYYTERKGSSRSPYAMFQVSGEVSRKLHGGPTTNGSVKDDEDAMMVDAEEDDTEDEEDVIYTRCVVVSESSLEDAVKSFTKVTSCHVYALSATKLQDPLQLCEPMRVVHEIDASSGEDFPQIVGRVVSGLVKTGDVKPTPTKAASKKRAIAPTASSANLQQMPKPPKADVNPESKIAPSAKPKMTGKLDWSKAKVKDEKAVKKDEEVSTKDESTKSSKAENEVVKPSTRNEKLSTKERGATAEKPSQGVKRKSDASELGESSQAKVELKETTPSVSNESTARVKKGVVLSESEDSDSQPKNGIKSTKARLPRNPMRKARSQSIATDSEAEKSLRAMWDIDDSEVIKVTRPTTAKPPPQSDDEAAPPATASEPDLDGDVEMDAREHESDQDVSKVISTKPKPRKRKEKKEVPLGRNGLRKKRVVKSRMTTDAKGYMVTEDYSSYESVDEEEPERPSTSKPKAKQPAKPKPKPKPALSRTASVASSGDEDIQMGKPTTDRSDTEAESGTHPFRTEPTSKPKPTKTYPGRSASGTASGSAAKKAGSKASALAGQSSLMNFFGKPKK